MNFKLEFNAFHCVCFVTAFVKKKNIPERGEKNCGTGIFERRWQKIIEIQRIISEETSFILFIQMLASLQICFDKRFFLFC